MPIKLGETPNDVTPQAPTGSVRISEMQPGDGFSFVSEKNPANTTAFAKMKSRRNIAVNLSTWKEVKFGDDEVGVPVQLALSRA